MCQIAQTSPRLAACGSSLESWLFIQLYELYILHPYSLINASLVSFVSSRSVGHGLLSCPLSPSFLHPVIFNRFYRLEKNKAKGLSGLKFSWSLSQSLDYSSYCLLPLASCLLPLAYFLHIQWYQFLSIFKKIVYFYLDHYLILSYLILCRTYNLCEFVSTCN